jgi:hypothetical protein
MDRRDGPAVGRRGDKVEGRRSGGRTSELGGDARGRG